MTTLFCQQLMVPNSEEMVIFGKKIGQSAAIFKGGAVIYLIGSLGAGKTTWVRGFLQAFGFHDIVKSPTYTLVEPYELEKSIFHFDFYRINSPQELELMGIRDYFSSDTICLIEWPQCAKEVIPSPDIEVNIAIENESRQVTLKAISQRGEDVLQAIFN